MIGGLIRRYYNMLKKARATGPHFCRIAQQFETKIVSGCFENQAYAVDTMTHARGRRSIVKDVTQM